MKRVRITTVEVTVHTMLDDDEADTLTPLAPATATYGERDWPTFDLDHVKAVIQRNVDKELRELAITGNGSDPALGPGPGDQHAEDAPTDKHENDDHPSIHGGGA